MIRWLLVSEMSFDLIIYFFRGSCAAAEEERKVRAIEEDVTIKTKICEADLRKAEPSLIAANEALNTLNKNNLTELKSFGTPPKAVINVCAAVLVLFSGKAKIPKDRSWRACKVCDAVLLLPLFVRFLFVLALSCVFPHIVYNFRICFLASQQMMGAVDKFLYKLENFEKENIPTKVIKALQPYLKVNFLI